MLLDGEKTGGLKIHENGNVEEALAINLEVRRAPENCTVILENTSNVEKEKWAERGKQIEYGSTEIKKEHFSHPKGGGQQL
jgi:hypothetical protein